METAVPPGVAVTGSVLILVLIVACSARVSRERERLLLQPAVADDTGQYICMLRNKSSCSRIAVRLQVLRRDQAVRSAGCPQVAMVSTEVLIGFQQGKTLTCPNLQDASKMADSNPTVNWTYMNQDMSRCEPYPFWDVHREQVGTGLQIHTMVAPYEGLYICTVRYRRRGGTLSFTRTIKVSGICESKPPPEVRVVPGGTGRYRAVPGGPTQVNSAVFCLQIPPLCPKTRSSCTQPTARSSRSEPVNSDVHLTCQGQLPFIIDKPEREIWWTVDGKRVEQLNDGRFTQTNSTIDDHRDLTATTILKITDVQSEDLQRNFSCSVRNARGSMSRWVQLEEEVSLPSVELGCGLGVTLVLMLLLFVVYHVFWLELLLLYRSWFGTDERHTDDKEFDVYISYARNGEEEQFVLSTLRSVLENELGYSVCIFDRDSLPGGTITDETLSFVARSRRLLVVVSPGYAAQGSQALLELKAGIDSMALGGHLRVILVQYRPVQRQSLVRELRRARVALALVRWKGDKSKELTSRFWKQLRVELPRAQRIRNQNHWDRPGRSRTGRRASANHRKTPFRGRGGVRREEGLQHSRRCSGCAGFIGQVEDRRVEIRGETQMQQELRNGTDTISETDSIIPDPTHKAHSHAPSPNHAREIHDPASSSDPALSCHQQQVDTSRTSEENGFRSCGASGPDPASKLSDICSRSHLVIRGRPLRRPDSDSDPARLSLGPHSLSGDRDPVLRTPREKVKPAIITAGPQGAAGFCSQEETGQTGFTDSRRLFLPGETLDRFRFLWVGSSSFGSVPNPLGGFRFRFLWVGYGSCRGTQVKFHRPPVSFRMKACPWGKLCVFTLLDGLRDMLKAKSVAQEDDLEVKQSGSVGVQLDSSGWTPLVEQISVSAEPGDVPTGSEQVGAGLAGKAPSEDGWSVSPAALCTEDDVDTGEPKASPNTRPLKLDSDSLDVSMVFWSFRPNIRSTQRSRFGSGEADPAEDSEQNSAVSSNVNAKRTRDRSKSGKWTTVQGILVVVGAAPPQARRGTGWFGSEPQQLQVEQMMEFWFVTKEELRNPLSLLFSSCSLASSSSLCSSASCSWKHQKHQEHQKQTENWSRSSMIRSQSL
ncbi:hypothetical protein CCH79_00018353 [Gambusia affinis]|uniref:Interleukin-1 receptor accessory protein n=1 Tax=Gambusia affinis TaxID=33528 RepID=A0A315V9J7_GAMAF|nr:hypothetical protein CCH79_00018353 [Gambusia affinis]